MTTTPTPRNGQRMPTTPAPIAWFRSAPAMAYASRSDHVILSGESGSTDTYTLTRPYALTTNTWTNMDPALKPSDPFWHAMAYDSGSDRVILLGGWDSTIGHLNDTW